MAMRVYIFFILFLLASPSVQAQEVHSITGKVKSERDGVLPAATIFLDGTEKKTYSDENGEFRLDNLSPGTYQLTVHYVGYNTLKQNVIIVDRSVSLKLELTASNEMLQEVVISASERSKYLGLFLRNFLGDTENGRSCKVLNPEILRFSEKGSLVTARTGDFLEIINENLGYKIKYLLRDFKLNRTTAVTSYTGECVFEDLKGTEEQKLKWAEARRSAYYGSMLHFLRSIYTNSTETEGFSCRFLQDENLITQRLSDKVEMHRLSKLDKRKLVTLRFMLPLYVQYKPVNQDSTHEVTSQDAPYKSFKEGKGAILVPFLQHAVIDRKGSLVDYRSFLVKLTWGTKRLGDQLPYEYKP